MDQLASLPSARKLGVPFDRLFPHRDDVTWIKNLDEGSVQRVQELRQFEALLGDHSGSE